MRTPEVVAIALCAGLIAMPARADALHEAARDGDTAQAEQLIAAGADVEAQDEAALTPLVTAALAGHRQIVNLLIDKGADPAGRDGSGFTALHAAAHAGHLDIVKLLLQRGVDINDQENEPKITPLHAAAERDRRDVAAALLAAGADMEIRADDGKTPIFMVTLKAHTEMVRLLRDHGANCSHIRSATFRDFCINAGS